MFYFPNPQNKMFILSIDFQKNYPSLATIFFFKFQYCEFRNLFIKKNIHEIKFGSPFIDHTDFLAIDKMF